MPPNDSTLKALNILNDAFRSSLHHNSPQVEQPSDIKVSLRPHQKSILYQMEQNERELSKGMDVSGGKLYSRFGILGDGVGVGKSLMILGHISRLKKLAPIDNLPLLDVHSSSQIYSLYDNTYGQDMSGVGCLIVVPHTLYRQWQGYLKDQTALSFLGVQTKNVLVEKNPGELAEKIRSADVVLVSNTLYGPLQEYVKAKRMIWKRVFLDEADTLHLPSTRPMFDSRFTWLISASWANLLFSNVTHYFPQSFVETFTSTNIYNADPDLVKFLKSTFQANGNSYYNYARFFVMSSSFLRDFIQSGNAKRGRLVIRCREEYVKESISLPPITIRNILCRTSVIQRVVANAIPVEVRNLLHAGDVQGALQHLGVKSEDSMSLINAVTENRNKELDRLKKTYEFKSSLEYSSPSVKEAALKSLKDKIGSLEEQIKQLKERIENYKDEMCPICFDEPQQPSLTPCCSRVFCAGCILTSLTRQPTCPLCRATMSATSLRHISTVAHIEEQKSNEPEPPQLLKKTEQLLELIRKNPRGKFLVFSRYDNPFTQISQEIETMNIAVKQVKGNKDVIASTLKGFQSGNTKVLLLNSIEAGAGLNITTATHIVLLHAMTHEEQKQIIGRAYRMGRTEPLEVIHLLHPDELAHQHSQ